MHLMFELQTIKLLLENVQRERERERAKTIIISSVLLSNTHSQQSLPLHSVLKSRELIDHAINGGFYGKENRRVEQIISQTRNQVDVVDNAVEAKKRGRKSDDQQIFLNSIPTSVASAPMSNNKSKCSFKQYYDFIPKTSRWRLFKEANKKEKKCYLMIPINYGRLLVKEKDTSFDI